LDNKVSDIIDARCNRDTNLPNIKSHVGHYPSLEFWSQLSLLLTNSQQASVCPSASPDLPQNLRNTIFRYCVNNSLSLLFFL